MAAVLHSFEGILTILIIILTGFFLSKKGWFSEDSVSLISRLVTNVTLPTYMMSMLLASFTRDSLLQLVHGLPIPVLSMTIGYILGHLVARLIHVHPARRGIFSSVFFLSNTIFIGLPLTLALFDESAVPSVMVYYMANTTFFWVLVAHDIAVDGQGGIAPPLLSMKTLKSVISPPLLGFIFGVLFLLLGWTLPQPILKAFKYIGGMTTPLAMIFIGIAISKYRWADIHLDREVVLAVLGRYVFSPLLVLALVPFFPVPVLMKQVFVMLAAMPAMTNTSIVAKYYGADYQYAAMLTVITTCLAIVVIPFYMWVLQG